MFDGRGILSVNILEAVFLGLLQGLTEFIPVSSSGHLVLAERLLGMHDDKANFFFNIMLHLASLAGVIVCFRKEIFALLTDNRRLILLLVVATIPAGIAGFLLKDAVETVFSRPIPVCAFLMLTGVILYFSERFASDRFSKEEMGIGRALAIGVAQAAAILPGLSRSGSTIGAGLVLGVKRIDAVAFSFLMSIPVIAGAGLLEIKDALNAQVAVEPLPIIVGAIASFVASLAAIRIVQFLAAGGRLRFFAWYCLAVGIVGIVCSILGS